MNRMLLYKKIYLRRSLSLAVCFTVLFVAYSAVSVYLETAAAYGEALASLTEPQQLSFSVRMLYGGARIFLLILFLVVFFIHRLFLPSDLRRLVEISAAFKL